MYKRVCTDEKKERWEKKKSGEVPSFTSDNYKLRTDVDNDLSCS